MRKSAEKSREEELKRKQDIVRQKEELQGMTRQYQERLLEEEQRLQRELEEEKWNFEGPKTGVEKSSQPIGRDMWSQLKRVSIPVFSGDKKTYEGWKTAFMACIDKAPATPEYKLLQLRQYLSGDALKAVETTFCGGLRCSERET